MPLKLDLSPLLEYPEAWHRQGKGLLCSSEVLWGHAQHSTPEALSMPAASLLGGYALENLLKALLVKQLRAAGESIVVKGRLRRELTRHDLIALAEAAGAPLARHERFLLERLTVTITWGGRYIAPKEVGETDSATMISTDRETIRLFAAKLDDMLEGKEPVNYDKLLNVTAGPARDH
jgi:hypothetical protein